MKATLRCHTPEKAQKNFRKSQRTLMNRKDRRAGKRALVEALVDSCLESD